MRTPRRRRGPSVSAISMSRKSACTSSLYLPEEMSLYLPEEMRCRGRSRSRGDLVCSRLQPTMLRLAVPVGALVTCRSLRAVRCRAAPQVNIVRVFHDVCGPDGCGERTEVHTVPVFTNLDGMSGTSLPKCRPPISPDGSRRSKGCGRQLPVTVGKRKPENPTLRPIHPTTGKNLSTIDTRYT